MEAVPEPGRLAVPAMSAVVVPGTDGWDVPPTKPEMMELMLPMMLFITESDSVISAGFGVTTRGYGVNEGLDVGIG